MTTARIGSAGTARPGRRPELEAIRTLVVVGLVFFHSALVFDTRDDYYVKNAETTGATTIAAGLGVVWTMPMLFLIAGLGSWHSLRRDAVPAAMLGLVLFLIGMPVTRSGSLAVAQVGEAFRRVADVLETDGAALAGR